MLKRTLLAITAATAAFAVSSAAGAVSLNIVNGPYSGPSFTPFFVENFESYSTGSVASGFSGGAVEQGTVVNQYQTPLGDTSKYYSVGPSTSTPATYAITPGTVGKISLYWGSMDTYNSLTLDGLGITFTGADVADPTALGDISSPGNNRTVDIYLTAAEAQLLTGITFASTPNQFQSGNAFEFDNLAFGAVPEPAAWMTMIAGFGLVGTAMRRRRANVAYA